MTLYEIQGEYEELLRMAEEDDLDPEAIKDTLESIEGDFVDKAESYANVILECETNAARIKRERDRLKEKQDRLEANAKRMRKALEMAMEEMDKKKFSSGIYKFSIQKNAPSLAIKEAATIPGEFYTQPDPILNRSAMIQYIKEHGEQSWGALSQTESLRIR